MKRASIRFLSVMLLLSAAQCGALRAVIQPTRVAVSLVNNSDFDVEVRLFTAENQEVPEDLIDDVGSERNFTLAPGQTQSFSDTCDNLQAIKIDRAQLRVIGDVFAPDESSDILRDGSDFNCGDRIIFTFDHTDVIVDFHIETRVERAR
jgi:hypothetical protein